MSHCQTSAFLNHLDYSFIVFKNLKSKARKWESFAFEVTWSTLINLRSSRRGCFFVLVLTRFLDCPLSYRFHWILGCFKEECNNSITKSQISRAGIPSTRKLASKEITSDSVEPCENENGFLHIQLMGKNVRLPNIHRIPPDVDFESWNNLNRQSDAVFSTWQYCLHSLVLWM